MQIYILLLYITILLSIIGFFLPQNSMVRKISILPLLFAFGVICFRDINIGVDTPAYVNYYLHPNSGYGHGAEISEFGYRFYQEMFARVIRDGKVFLALTSLISVLPIYYLVSNLSKNRALSAFIFFSIGSTTTVFLIYLAAVRQCLAVSFLLWSFIGWYYSKEKSKIIWMILYAIACSIHYSMLIYIPFFFIVSLQLKKKWYYYLLGGTFVLGYFLQHYFVEISIIANMLEKGYYASVLEDNVYSIGITLPLMLLAVVLVYFKNNYEIYDKLFIFGVAFNNAFSMMGDSVRMILPLIIWGVLAIPNFIIDKKNVYYIRLGLLFVMLSYFSYKYNTVLTAPSSRYVFVPYKSMF